MSKTVHFKSDVFGGSVTFSDPLSLEQEAAIERANYHLMRVMKNINGEEDGAAIRALAVLPGILACVEKWSLSRIPENPTVQTWPTRPRAAVASLTSWLFSEVGKIYTDSQDEEIPNASVPQRMPTPAAKEPSPESYTSLSVLTDSELKQS